MATIYGTKYNDNDTWQWVRIDFDGPIKPLPFVAPGPLSDGLVPFEWGRFYEFLPTLKGTSYDDNIFGGEGNDILYGNLGNDKLFGHAGNDGFHGGYGNDYLSGGAGQDYLRGGVGADTFDFDSAGESLAWGAYDTIADFSWEEGDKIDLSTIDANSLIPGDQAFDLNQLTYSPLTGVLMADVYASEFFQFDDLQVKVVGVDGLPVSGFDPSVAVIA